MVVTKKVLKEGDNMTKPINGDMVKIEYTGWLHDITRAADGYKGKQFDTSVNRGHFETVIGRGKVIQGWETAVVEMSLGEKSELTITSEDAYGENRGFPYHIPPNSDPILYHIPPNSDLIFDVELKDIKRNGSDKWLSELSQLT